MLSVYSILDGNEKEVFVNSNFSCFAEVFVYNKFKLTQEHTFRIFVSEGMLNITKKEFLIWLRILNRWGFKNKYKWVEKLTFPVADTFAALVSQSGSATPSGWHVDLKVSDLHNLSYLKIAAYLIRYAWEAGNILKFSFADFKKIKQEIGWEFWQVFVYKNYIVPSDGHKFYFSSSLAPTYSYSNKLYTIEYREILTIKEYLNELEENSDGFFTCIGDLARIEGNVIKTITFADRNSLSRDTTNHYSNLVKLKKDEALVVDVKEKIVKKVAKKRAIKKTAPIEI